MLARLKLHFDVAIKKLEEHSSSLEAMSILSYVSGAKRNTYAAEDCMGMFRKQTLCAGMKRIELISCVVAIKLDRRRDPDNLFAGWNVPGISRPAACMKHDWQNGVLVRRMRNIRERGGWMNKPKKLKAVGSEYARLEAKEAAARDKKEREALKAILKVDVSQCIVGGRSLLPAEFPTYELFRTGPRTYDFTRLSPANGFSRGVCNVLFKILQALPAHLNPFMNANVQAALRVQKTVPVDPAKKPTCPGVCSYFEGLPTGAPTSRSPSFTSNTQGKTANSYPDVKLKHAEVIERLRLLLRCMQTAGFPVVAERSRVATTRPGDDADAASSFVAPTPSVLLRVPAAVAMHDSDDADGFEVLGDGGSGDDDDDRDHSSSDESSCSDSECGASGVDDGGWDSSDSDDLLYGNDGF
jgi:hypothetical protein